MPKFAYIRLLTSFLACCINNAHAQLSIHVSSFEDHTTLAYASIVNHTSHQLLFTDEAGRVPVNFSAGDSITISYVGYHSLKTVFKPTQQYYMLRQLQDLLKPVQMENCKRLEQTDYTNLSADSSERKFGGVRWDREHINAKVAVMLIPGVKHGRLNSFSIWLKTPHGAPKISVQAPLQLSFYAINDSTKLPGALISNRAVVYHPKKEGRQTIRLDSLQLPIPAAGLYVCIEYPVDDHYVWPIRYVDREKGIDSIALRYGPGLDGVYSKDFVLAFYNYQEDKWVFAGRRDKSILATVHGTIKCSAGISSCKD